MVSRSSALRGCWYCHKPTTGTKFCGFECLLDYGKGLTMIDKAGTLFEEESNE